MLRRFDCLAMRVGAVSRIICSSVRDALDHLEPAVHAQRQHALLDGGLPDLGGADVLHDQLRSVGVIAITS